MQSKVAGTWADDTTVRAELTLEPGDGHGYVLIVYEAHYSWRDDPELRVILENESGHRMVDYSVQEPSRVRVLPETYRFVEERTADVDGLTFALAVYTESFGYDDPEQSIQRRMAIIVRRGEREHWLQETGAGYVREVEYVPPPRPPKPPVVWPELVEPEAALYCPDCDVYVDLESGIPLYECSRCGQATAERRCEDCHIFTAKLSDNGCPECEAAELEETGAIRDIDGNLHPTEERQ